MPEKPYLHDAGLERLPLGWRVTLDFTFDRVRFRLEAKHTSLVQAKADLLEAYQRCIGYDLVGVPDSWPEELMPWRGKPA